MSPQIKAAVSYCDKFGMKTYFQSDRKYNKPQPTWNGLELALDECRDPEWLLHELAHFLTGDIRYENWGLGQDPGGGAWSEKQFNNNEIMIAEDFALLYTITLLLDYGLDCRIRSYCREYGLEYMKEKELVRAQNILNEMKLQVKHLPQEEIESYIERVKNHR